MKKIKLTNGGYAIVDREDYPFLNKFSWYSAKEGIFASFRAKVGQGQTQIPLHNFLVKRDNNSNVVIMHRNGNKTDFRKNNLFYKHWSVRQHKSKKRKGFYTSEYKGVCKIRSLEKWIATITKDKTYYLGSYIVEAEAAEAYNKKARELYGKYAYQNTIK